MVGKGVRRHSCWQNKCSEVHGQLYSNIVKLLGLQTPPSAPATRNGQVVTAQFSPFTSIGALSRAENITQAEQKLIYSRAEFTVLLILETQKKKPQPPIIKGGGGGVHFLDYSTLEAIY